MKSEILKEKASVQVILCPLIGISLKMYNWIKHENACIGLETPMLERKIHKHQGNGRLPLHRYSKLKHDGLHLSGTMRNDWVAEFVRVMQHHDA